MGINAIKVQETQELFPEDHNRRLEFCESMREKADSDEHFLNNVLFTDESSFFLHKHHNHQITRYWSTENKHLSIPVRTQYPQKLNVWVGLLGESIVGPFFINGSLNSNKYLTMLQQQIIPAVRALRINLENVWFQQDGCPAHNSRQNVVFAGLQHSDDSELVKHILKMKPKARRKMVMWN
ncbi:hypothetical protein NQ318_023235 [Aromia moschata]|uniref:Transposase n=1 Tax=Aromia moschata TaxID=1265417 RepID=A0AAV8XMN4_9CUCU|nr:hypothetical protein NQ318_023235 [Aromia moschata]